jgi:hypothetical protein
MFPRSSEVSGIRKWYAYWYRALTETPQVPIPPLPGYDNWTFSCTQTLVTLLSHRTAVEVQDKFGLLGKQAHRLGGVQPVVTTSLLGSKCAAKSAF